MMEAERVAKVHKKLGVVKRWIVMSSLLLMISLSYLYPFLISENLSFLDWITNESYKRHLGNYWAFQLLSPLLIVVSLGFLVYNLKRYFSLRKKLK